MKIIEQSHEILKMDDLNLIEIAGRTCYKSEDKIGCTNDSQCPNRGKFTTIDCWNCEYHSSYRFTKQLIKRGHEAILEHGSATVRFITSRSVTHELVRHRIGVAYAQESQRYCNYGGKDIEFIRSVSLPYDTIQYNGFKEVCEYAEEMYNAFISEGYTPEHAREVLPNATKTEIIVTANYRAWRHILNLRAVGTTGRPHPQMQALMKPLLEEFKEKLPAMFEDL